MLRMISTGQPRLEVMLLLGADDLARRLRAMRGEQFVVSIVRADDIEHVGEAIVVIVTDVRPEQCLGDRPRGIGFMTDVDQPLEDLLGEFFPGGVANLVADTPENHAGMIAVAENGITQVRLGPFVEEQVVVERILGDGPAVKEFVHDEKTHAVAEIEEIRCRWIVRGTDGVHAEFAKFFEAMLPYSQRHRRAKRAAVVMQANAFEFEIAAIQPEAGVGLELEMADAEAERVGVQEAGSGLDINPAVVRIPLVEVPEQGVGNADFALNGNRAPGRDGLRFGLNRVDVSSRIHK